MNGLNTQRTEFKHGGRLPHAKNVAAILPSVSAFCEEVCAQYLHLEYPNVSLAVLIQNADAKTHSEAAEIASTKGDLEEAMKSLSFAFAALYTNAREKHGDDLLRNIVWREPHFRTGHHDLDREVESFVKSLGMEGLISQLNDLCETVNMLALGGDPTSLRRLGGSLLA